jgi:hypothetical protein
LLLAACAAPKPEIPDAKPHNKPDTSGIEINGDASDPVSKFDGEYEPVKGGFFAVHPSSGDLPPCAADASKIAGNALYYPSEDVVAWDAENLLPELKDKFGDFAIPVALAHEWGHAIQARSTLTARTVTKELQGDCFAGAWAKQPRTTKRRRLERGSGRGACRHPRCS